MVGKIAKTALHHRQLNTPMDEMLGIWTLQTQEYTEKFPEFTEAHKAMSLAKMKAAYTIPVDPRRTSVTPPWTKTRQPPSWTVLTANPRNPSNSIHNTENTTMPVG